MIATATENDSIEGFYQTALKAVISAGYGDEISYQRAIIGSEITEQRFLAESAWVILNSGFKESYIRKIWSSFSLCFWDWTNAHYIAEKDQRCRNTGLSVFGNQRKVDAIIDLATTVSTQGFCSILTSIEEDPVEELQLFPMIGPRTAQHLAKNLGFPFAKADRHLERIREHFGFDDVQSMCAHLSKACNERVPVIDIVLWRFMTFNPQ